MEVVVGTDQLLELVDDLSRCATSAHSSNGSNVGALSDESCPTTSQIFANANETSSGPADLICTLDTTLAKEYENGNPPSIASDIEELFTDGPSLTFLASHLISDDIIDILQQYQEQPQLLDPHLGYIISAMVAIIKQDQLVLPTCKTAAFRIIYVLSKVRGYKTVMKCFSHEATDLIYVLESIEKEPPSDHSRWECRYVLLLWLALISLLPFDISIFDEHKDGTSLPERVMIVCTTFLESSDKSQDAAAQASARFFTRPDMVKSELKRFLLWCSDTLANAYDLDRAPVVIGVMLALPALFKFSKREDILPYASEILQLVYKFKLINNTNTLVRKQAAKLVQRCGLSYLPPRILTWRYQRGMRSLALNIQSSDAQIRQIEAKNRNGSQPHDQDMKQYEGDINFGIQQLSSDAKHRPVGEDGDLEEDDFDIPSELEDVIDVLLVGLSDKDTIVRWSCAKGVGRITARLPKAFADDILDSVLGLFTYDEVDTAWHGGCLSVAELARRGLLLPSHLEQVVPVVVRALRYDIVRGSCSVGAHVRDAACYVCWAFARAYAPDVLRPFVETLACELLATSVFDRECNVRRAAAAALQENIGRLGTVPHGIDIVTTADYFAVGNRKQAFLNIAFKLCHHAEYQNALLRHLIVLKLLHWDEDIRQLAALTIIRVCRLNSDFTIELLQSIVLNQILSIDLNIRQGAVYGLGAIVLGLSPLERTIHPQAIRERNQRLVQANQFFMKLFGAKVISKIQSIVSILEQAMYFKGLGSNIVRKACVCTIGRLAQAGFPVSQSPESVSFETSSQEQQHFTSTDLYNPLDSPALNSWKNVCLQWLEDTDEGTREAAITAYVQLLETYYVSSERGVLSLKENVVPMLVSKVSQSNISRPQCRSSAALVMSQLPTITINSTWKE
eukprot:gene1365-4540_t